MHVSIFHFADVEGNFDKWKSPALVLLSFLRVDLPPQDRGIMVHGIFFFCLSFLNDRKSGASKGVKSRASSFFLELETFFFGKLLLVSMVFR